ncbi:MAG: TonB-dependent receptor [Gammaproteobacteria bacterium]|nr:TonB-dependent receptor [Gammaproteobacteria bacterium]
MKTLRTGILTICLPLLISHAYAEDDLLQLLDQENEVYAASRYAQSLEDTPASVSLLSREDIARYGYTTLDQVIMALPGVHDASNLAWPMYGIRGFAKPGDICSRFAVLINGMPTVYDPVFGGTCFHLLDIETLKRVEFVRGPGSSLYGSGAALGVINLVTVDAEDVNGAHLSVRASSDNESQGFASLGRRWGEFKFFTSLSAKYRKGIDYFFPEHVTAGADGWSRGNDGQNLYRHFARLQFKDIWMQWRIERNRKVDPSANYGTEFNSDQLVYDDRSLSVEIGDMIKIGGGSLLIRSYYNDFKEYGDYPFANNLWYDNIFTRQLGAELRLETYVSDLHHVSMGSDLRMVQGRQVGGGDGLVDHDIKENYGQAAVYAQDEFAFGGGRVTVGARYDYYQSYTANVRGRLNPRLAYVHRLTQGTSAKLVYGEAYRVPTQYEIFYDDNSSKIANTSLLPEVVRTLEVIVEHNGSSGVRSGVSAYLTRLEKAIVLRYPDPNLCPDPAISCSEYVNLDGYQQVVGLEGHWSMRNIEGVRYYTSFNTQRGINEPSGAQLSAAPAMLLKAGMTVPLFSSKNYAGLEGRYTSSALGTVGDIPRTQVPDFMRMDVFAAVALGHKSWNLLCRIDNVFDQHGYIVQPNSFLPVTRTPTLGRTFTLRLSHAF